MPRSSARKSWNPEVDEAFTYPIACSAKSRPSRLSKAWRLRSLVTRHSCGTGSIAS